MTTGQEIKKFATYCGWTDREPFEVVRAISDQTVEIRAMDAVRNPDWKPEWVVGGFSGVCVNDKEQRWIITSNPDNPVSRIRWSKANQQWQKGKYCRFYMADKPCKYYDNNF